MRSCSAIQPKVRQISVPTTIAGGEFSAIAGVTNRRTGVKEMLRHPLVMPRSLKEVGVTPEHFNRIAEQAMKTPWVPRNPRRIESPAQIHEILLLAA